MTNRENPDIDKVLAASDQHILAQELVAATGLRTTIVHEGPVIDRDPLAGAYHAAMVALHRFGLAPENGTTPEGGQ